MLLRTPIVASVIGEGGSGGALGIGVADRVLMLENAYYSVISPEGCAAILWKHRSHAPEAAEALKLTAVHLKELELIDEVIPEPLGGAHQDHEWLPESPVGALGASRSIDQKTGRYSSRLSVTRNFAKWERSSRDRGGERWAFRVPRSAFRGSPSKTWSRIPVLRGRFQLALTIGLRR